MSKLVRAVALGIVSATAIAATNAAAATLRDGDATRGETIYTRCAACHSLESDRTGPRHCGLFGRRAGSVAGFDYSAAMKSAGVTWDAATLDRFLAGPLRMVPGTTMTYAGIADARERADLIAYLRVATARCGQRSAR